MKNRIENYQLHAYLDGELTHEECLEIEQALKEDAELRFRLEKFSTLKSDVKKAYLNLPIEQYVATPKEKKSNLKDGYFNIAASLFLGVMIGAGLITYSVEPNVMNSALVEQNQSNNRFLVHIDTNDIEKQHAALLQIEQIFVESTDKVQVDLVSNSTGIEMLDKNNPATEELQGLLKRFDGLTVYACQRALERAQKAGKPIELIPEAVFDRPAIDRLAERLTSGWKYIKI
ncbi:zf-HC2 domain-containing protein [Thiomicrorhabdus sediminis]|uniref:Putative zinc-finger domain-containing protein n=1 Tax=Thiomicrorhabdus sediminis TaxID=2580412 RepID=A0A4P9K2U8_9GAMM|nr:zf-HC2 domain-containing protein [Thiomicrorhabdus sediminis]QCU89172.1 hypothetical protein FE785_00295 [Thiomicrorhabdus sediminis]